jgi:hypothetical protein
MVAGNKFALCRSTLAAWSALPAAFEQESGLRFILFNIATMSFALPDY